MSRTPEQIAADNALTEALEGVWAAYCPEPDPGVLLEYTVLATRRGMNIDGSAWSSFGAFTRDDNVPTYVQMGMLQYRLTRLKQSLSEYEDED
ncbi:hypothetical protein [Nocardia brasiliensis]|uniref:hypothetical protein n=1 Tax=Nocardia brasiliensis TaxID=37326 RepID=UPI002458863D|nr:hypothetical protein [Nocardia brasiliensis]